MQEIPSKVRNPPFLQGLLWDSWRTLHSFLFYFLPLRLLTIQTAVRHVNADGMLKIVLHIRPTHTLGGMEEEWWKIWGMWAKSERGKGWWLVWYTVSGASYALENVQRSENGALCIILFFIFYFFFLPFYIFLFVSIYLFYLFFYHIYIYIFPFWLINPVDSPKYRTSFNNNT